MIFYLYFEGNYEELVELDHSLDKKSNILDNIGGMVFKALKAS